MKIHIFSSNFVCFQCAGVPAFSFNLEVSSKLRTGKKERQNIQIVLSSRSEKLYTLTFTLRSNFTGQVIPKRPWRFGERAPATVLLFELNSALRVTRDAGTDMHALEAILDTTEGQKKWKMKIFIFHHFSSAFSAWGYQLFAFIWKSFEQFEPEKKSVKI